MTAKPVLDTLKHVWESLAALHLPMAVVGGLALAAWKHVRATRDVDLLIDLTGADPDAVLQTLRAVGFRPKRSPPILQFGDNRILQVLYEPPGVFVDLQVDLLLADSEYERKALQRRVATVLSDSSVEVFVLSCEDLILHKLLAGRIIDRADGVGLLRSNRAALDWKYLLDWAPRLGVTAEWEEVWTEAFPGESGPPVGTNGDAPSSNPGNTPRSPSDS
jgi:hypothetical protein